MLPGEYDQTADVRNLTTYAVVGGVRREIESVNLDREVAHDLPDNIAGGSGIGGGSGSIVWSPQDARGFRLPTQHGRITYHWDGVRHASASIMRVDGVEVARNYVPNPSFENGTTGWSSFNGTLMESTTEYAQQMFGKDTGDHVGYGVLEPDQNNAGFLVNTTVTVEPGQWVGVRALIAAERLVGVRDRLLVHWNTPSGTTYAGTWRDSAYWYTGAERHDVFQAPADAESMQLRVHIERGGASGQIRHWVDHVMIIVADNQEDAEQLIASYWDGDTPEIPGQIVFPGTDAAVEHSELSPWSPVSSWPPSPGDVVKVYVTDGHTTWPRFTGRIDKTRGPIGSNMVSDIVDFRDKLNTQVTVAARLRHDVPVNDASPYRWLGMDYWSIMTDVLRRARVFTTPIAGDDAMVSAQLQGSALAHIGQTREAHGGAEGRWPRFHVAPWGWAAGELYARYRPSPAATIPTKSQTIQVTLMVAPGHIGNSQIYVGYGGNLDNNHIRIRVWSDRRVTAYWDNTAVITMSAAQMRNATTVVLLVKGSTWTFRNDQGQTTTGTRSRSGSQPVSEIRVYNDDGARVAGLVIDSPIPALEFRNQYFTPNATFTPSSMVLMMNMSPRLEKKIVGDVVNEICQATLTAAWFDETGVFRMMPSDRLRDAQPVQQISTLHDILGFEWETSLLDYRSVVHVNWRSAAVSRTRRQRLELYRGAKSTLGEGDVIETFATPDNNTEWFGVDRNPIRLNDSNWGYYNRNLGSLTGVHYMRDDDQELSTSSRTTTIRVEDLGTVGMKITHTAGSYGSNVEGNLATSENAAALRESKRGEALPVVRGRGEGSWDDETTTSSRRGSPLPDGTEAAELVHNLGPWGYENSARRIADFLAERVTRAEPTIRGLTVTYDPRRQLGDVVTMQAGILGITLRALIVGINESHAPGEHAQDLKVRVIEVNADRDVTYQQLSDAWSGKNYAAFQAAWANLSYRELQQHPLRGA